MLKYGIGKTNIFKLLDDKDGQEICICQFIEKYNISSNLNRYFQYDENCNSYNKIFGNIKYIEMFPLETHENLEKSSKFVQYFYFCGKGDEERLIEMKEPDNKNTNTLEKTNKNSNYDLPLDKKRERIEEFFASDNGQEEEHALEDSICEPLIGQRSYKPYFYYCKQDPKVENINLKSIEDHIRLKDPERHKTKILEFIKNISNK